MDKREKSKPKMVLLKSKKIGNSFKVCSRERERTQIIKMKN